MFGWLLQVVLRHAYVVVATLFLLLGFSAYSLRTATFDVFPEFAPPEVLVQTEAPGFSSEQVETLITQPIETALGGTKGVTAMRSTSIQGVSAVQLIFALDSDIMLDRQLIGERIASLSSSLPAGVAAPAMAPLSSTTNVVLGVGLTSDTLDATQLRTVADWLIKPRLLSATGVADVESYGGHVRQVQVQVDPQKLIRYGLSFDEVIAASRLATGVKGAGVIDTPQQRITLNSSTNATSLQTLAETPLTRGASESLDLSITLGDVASISESYQTPFSGAAVMGKPGVLLMITAQYGANTLEATRNIEAALRELEPVVAKQHVKMWSDLIRPANFIEIALKNVGHSLMIGALLVTLILFLFLRNWRAAVISALAIPFSLIMAAALLNQLGMSLNTMTLGGLAIAVGLIVDDAVIDVENVMRHMRSDPLAATHPLSRYELVYHAVLEVRVPVVIASLAILLIAVPIMTMPGLGGRLFAPLGVAYALATFVSLAVALTLTPALCMLFLRKHNSARQRPTIPRLQQRYMRVLEALNTRFALVVGVCALTALVCIGGIATLKSQFIPELHEGHFIVHMEMQTGTSLNASIEQGNKVAASLLELPYIRHVVQQVGRTEGGIDIWGTHISEFNVALDEGIKIDEAEAKQAIEAKLESFPDTEFEVSTFLTERVEEVIAGYTSDAVLNIYGSDLVALDTMAASIASKLESTPFIKNVSLPTQGAIPQLSILLDHAALKHWSIEPATVLDTIHTAYESEVVGQLYDSDHPTALTVIIDPTYRQTPDQLADLPLHTPSGEYVKLREIAQISEAKGRYAVLRDGGRRVQSIAFNIDAQDKSSVLKDVNAMLAQQTLPQGMYATVASLTQEAASDQRVFLMHSLFALIGILLLLSLVLPHVRTLAILMATTPLALSGIFVVTFLGEGVLSLGTMVGCIALVGISLRNGVLMLAHYRYVVLEQKRSWDKTTVWNASAERLLPILMTALITAIGILPIALASHEPGREIEGPMAIVMLAGLISSTLFSLFILPPLALRYSVIKEVSHEIV